MKAWTWMSVFALSGPVAFFACSAVEQPNIGDFNAIKGGLTPPKVKVVGAICTAPVNPSATGCTASWTTDVFPKLLSTGDWHCTNAGCHNHTDGQPAPYGFGLGPSPTPSSAYSVLVAATSLPKATINPCSTVPSDSYLYCNMGGAGSTQCGTPMPAGARGVADPPPAGADKLQAWLQCGAPLN